MKIRRALVCLVPFALIACSDAKNADESTSTSTTSTTVADNTTTSAPQEVICDVTVGVDSGATNRCEAKVGATVRITVLNPDAADELHLHDYDLTTGEIAAGEEASIVFTADKDGEFELESHVTEEVMMILVVSP